MDFKKLIGKAKKTVDDRGGVDSLKGDAEELKGIVSRKGSVTDKAKDAAKALKEPGAPGRNPAPNEEGESRPRSRATRPAPGPAPADAPTPPPRHDPRQG